MVKKIEPIDPAIVFFGLILVNFGPLINCQINQCLKLCIQLEKLKGFFEGDKNLKSKRKKDRKWKYRL